jgi:hypothetical protein
LSKSVAGAGVIELVEAALLTAVKGIVVNDAVTLISLLANAVRIFPRLYIAPLIRTTLPVDDEERKNGRGTI